jgi:hypothetical protein
LPADPADALDAMRRQVHRPLPPRKVPARPKPCEACGTAQCACGGPQVKTVTIHCQACGQQTVAPHDHAPQKSSGRTPPAILHLRAPQWRTNGAARVPGSEHKNCADYVLETYDTKNVLTTPTADTRQNGCSGDGATVVDAALTAYEQATAGITDVAARLVLLEVAAQRFADARAPGNGSDRTVTAPDLDEPDDDLPKLGGQYRPAREADSCDKCGGPLAPADMLRCSACARAS